MYKLVLLLPFNITLLWRYRFETEEDAVKKKNELPFGFKVLPDSEPLNGVIFEVPRKHAKKD